MSTQVEYVHGTQVSVLRGCTSPDGADLLAVGGEHSVDVLLISDDSCSVVASFHVGSRVTAIAWSPRSSSPSKGSSWFIELAIAGEDLKLRLLTKSHKDASEDCFTFDGGLERHSQKINDLTFCGGFGEDSYRYLASVSDDKLLLLWDLAFQVEQEQDALSPPPSSPAPQRLQSPSSQARSEPVALPVRYSHPLHSVASHPSTSKELVISDSQGSVFVVDWRVDPDIDEPGGNKWLSVAQLVDPRALADARTGLKTTWGGSVDWQRGDINVIGAAYGSRWSLWDMRNLQGGRPVLTGEGFAQGTHRFRFHPTQPLLALSTRSPRIEAPIHIHNLTYTQSAPRKLFMRAVKDIDWVCAAEGASGIQSFTSGEDIYPRLAAASGQSVFIVKVGVEEGDNLL